MSVQSAIAEVKRAAQAHCPRCGDGPIPVMAARAGTPHTCEQDLAAALEALLAAHDDVCSCWVIRGIACEKRCQIQALANPQGGPLAHDGGSATGVAKPSSGDVEQVIREMRRLVRLNPYAVPMRELRSLLRRAAAACDGK